MISFNKKVLLKIMQHQSPELQNAINRFHRLGEPKVQRGFVTQKQYAAKVIAAALAILAIFVQNQKSLQFIYVRIKAYFKAFYEKLEKRAPINVDFAKRFFSTVDIIVHAVSSYFTPAKDVHNTDFDEYYD